MISLYNKTSYQTTIPLFYRPYPCGQPLIDFLQRGGPFTEPLTTVRVTVLWWRRHSFCHVRLGVNFMSWCNFCVLVWLSLPWRDFITLSDIRTCGHVMDDVIPLWWSRESRCDFFSVLDEISVLVGFCLSWWDFIPWCNQPNFGVIFLGFGNNFVLMTLDLFWCRFISWCDQLHLGMIFLHFARLFRLSVILFDLV